MAGKDVIRIALVVLVAVLALKWIGKARNQAHHKNDPTQFSQASRVWLPGLAPTKAEPGSQQPQSMLYT